MSTREDFEAWLETESGYANKLITPVEKDAWWQAYKAATSRQEDKIKALRDSLNWALSSIIEEPYEWSSEENTDAHNAAIAAAKETS